MNTEKQKLLLEYFISSEHIFALISPILKPSYFDVEFRKGIKFIINYYNEYNNIPSPDLINAESKIKLNNRTITKDEQEYCLAELEQFCQRGALINAVLKSAELIHQDDGDDDGVVSKGVAGSVESLIKQAVSVGVTRSVGVDIFDIDAADKLLEELGNNLFIPTGYTEFDAALGGGLKRQQMLLFSANSGGGKSMMMANFGITLVEKGYTVLYISLELSVKLIFARYISMITGLRTADDMYHQKQHVLDELKQYMFGTDAKLFVEHMPVGTTSNQIRAFLREFELKHKKIPDCIILDYLDLMGANEVVSSDNVSGKDKLCSEQFRQILVDFDMIGITASQQNRSGIGNDAPNQAVIAGGLTKVNTTDDYVSIMWDEVKKAAGEVWFHFLKTRSSDGVGTTVHMKWDKKYLRIRNKDQTDEKKQVISIKPKSSKVASMLAEMAENDD